MRQTQAQRGIGRAVLRVGSVMLLAAGCATTPAPSAAGPHAPGDGTLVGRFGLGGETSLSEYPSTLTFERQGDRRRFAVLLRWEQSKDGGDTIPFAISLPAGHYRLTKWEIYAGDCVANGPDVGMEIDLAPAAVTCLGTIRFGWNEKGSPAFARGEGCGGQLIAARWNVKGRSYPVAGATPPRPDPSDGVARPEPTQGDLYLPACGRGGRVLRDDASLRAGYAAVAKP